MVRLALWRLPLCRRDGVDARDVHGIDLLERAVLGLVEQEEDGDGEGGAAPGEDEAVQPRDGVDDEAGAKPLEAAHVQEADRYLQE